MAESSSNAAGVGGANNAGKGRTISEGGFDNNPEDGFQDDELIQAAQEEDLEVMEGGRNFIEHDDFENELGSPGETPFEDDYSEIAKHEIIDVIGDDKASRPVVVIYAHRLPSNKSFNHHKFLVYLLKTLDKFVENDYTIVYFHYGLKSDNKPPMRWLIQAYRSFDRKYKKNLKALYLVHPTKFLRFCYNIFKPIISSKFERKLHYVNYLSELKDTLHTGQLGIPQQILDHDKAVQEKAKPKKSASIQQLTLPSQQFGVQLSYILEHHNGCEIPPVVTALMNFLRSNDNLKTEGIFRRSAPLSEVRNAQERINKGEPVDFNEYSNVHLGAMLLKGFLRELAEPVMTFPLYPQILEIQQKTPEKDRVAAVKALVSQLPKENYRLLMAVIGFLTEVIEHSGSNKMTSHNLALVFGPNLAWPKAEQVSLAHLQHLNGFAHLLITNYTVIFNVH